MNHEKIVSLSVGLADYILLTKTPSRLNLAGFQLDLDCFSDVKFEVSKPKKGEIKVYNF